MFLIQRTNYKRILNKQKELLIAKVNHGILVSENTLVEALLKQEA